MLIYQVKQYLYHIIYQARSQDFFWGGAKFGEEGVFLPGFFFWGGGA